MGMYCWCGERRNTEDENGKTAWDINCICSLTGFVKCSERLPEKECVYEVRCQTDSADIYHELRAFSLIPRVVENDGYYGNQTNSYHWDGESWDGDLVMMWREVNDD